MQEQAVASFRPSPQQEQLWLASPDGPRDRHQVALLIEGEVDEATLRAAVERAVTRHEILRTTYERRPGMRVPLQVVRDELAPAWETRAGNAAEILAAEEAHAFDLEQGPILRAVLADTGDEGRLLVLTVPAVAADGGSLTTLARDVATAYAGGELASQPLQYADYSEWQHELLESADDTAEAGRRYWHEAVEATTPTVPFLFPDAADGRQAAVALTLRSETTASLDAHAERYGVSVEALVHAAWHALLARVSGSEDIALATLASERPHSELEDAIGRFARPVPVGLHTPADVTFAELLDSVAQTRAEAFMRQDYLPASTTLPSVGFVGSRAFETVSINGTTFQAAHRSAATSGLALAAEWTATDDSWNVRLVHDAGAYAGEHAERLARSFARLLEDVASDPAQPLAELELLDQEERNIVLQTFNATSAPVDTQRVDELIAAAAKRAGTRTAVVDASSSLTYDELERRANQLAHRLQREGAKAGTVVALCTDRSTEMVIGIVGILKTGAAYLPLNFEHPPARVAHQLEESGAVAVVTQERVLDRLPDAGGVRICLDRDRAELDAEPVHPVETGASPDDIAYVIYTSGSTGTPKGVGVTHANVGNYVAELVARLGADEEPLAFGMVTAISTDLGNTAVFPALCSGGTLVLVPPAVAADAAAFAAQEQEIDVLKITPSHLASLAAGPDSELRNLLPRRWLVMGGEAASWDLVARVRKVGTCRVLNHYGPTETTIGSCTYEVADGAPPYKTATVPIGRPIRNTACYVLDGALRPVPVGVAGELYISGAGVARGYVGQPEETARRFLADPFADGGRMYATGDLARWLPDGTIEFLGRRDEQVKIRGFRVEPAEIESALRSHTAVREAAVVARDDGRGERRLVAYVVGDGVDEDDLRRHTGEWVPDFMIPAAFVSLDDLPRTPSGKIDRQALPAPEEAATSQRRDHVAPRTPTEEQVAEIWREILGVEEIGVTDDFFAVGGHSLLATQIVARIRAHFAIDLPLHALFSSPTIETLSQSVDELAQQEPDAETAALLQELEGLSDEEAKRLLAGEGESA
jgi:amino acid adenylation domain-containing protein